MRNFKRFLTLALAVMMVVSMFAINTSAAAFTDVDEDNEYLAKAVNLLNYVGVIKGTSETTFSPDAPVTREQMAAFLYRIMNKGKSVNNGANSSTFTDLEDPTFFFSVSWANQKGFVKGTSATTFNPKGGITLQDAYTMIVRALGYETEETLPYPFGYITVAEGKNVDLAEGLDSSVSYGDALTRGDVAILLYNMFFAETGVAETKQVERELGAGTPGHTFVLETEKYYPVFCEKHFDVFGVEYQVIATPGYVLSPAASATTKSFGYDAVHFATVYENGVNVNADTAAKNIAEFYFDFADLGLEGEADDYIMAHVNMYVTLDKDDQIDEVLYAESLMSKKTVNEMKFETLATETKNSYFDVTDNESAKLLTGKVTLGTDVAYFYNAPYAYITPSYKNANTDALKYNARNADNLKTVSFAPVTAGEFDELTITTAPIVTPVNYAVDEPANFATQATDVVTAFEQAYAGGLFAADIYDVDGDGRYEYINYKPYGFYFADGTAKKTLADHGVVATPDHTGTDTYYIGGANIVGGELEDGDAFIGYVDDTLNLIEVAEVIAPVDAQITNKKANGTITLDNGEKVSSAAAGNLVSNATTYGAFTTNLAAAKYVVEDVEWYLTGLGASDNDVYEQDITFYVYDGAILFQEGVEASVKYDGANLIILDGAFDKTNGTFDTTTRNQWTAAAGDAYFVTAYVDGELKLIPVETDTDVTGILPAVSTTDYAAVANKLATYTVDKNGVYTIKLLETATDAETGDPLYLPTLGGVDDKLATKDEANAQAIATVAGTVTLDKVTTNRFKLTGAASVPQLLITDDTKVIIKSAFTKGGKNKLEYVELTADDLTASLTNSLTNVQIILQNNTKYTDRENLVVLYAETATEVEFAGKKTAKADRIVVSSEVEYVDGEYVVLYEVMNPYTGATESVYGTKTATNSTGFSAAYASGDVVELTGGKVDDETVATFGNVANVTAAAPATDDFGLFWVVGYDEETAMIEVVRYDTSAASNFTGATTEDDVVYATGLTTYYVNIADAAVSVLKNTGTFKYNAALSIKEAAGLNGEDEAYLAYNSSYIAIEDTADPDAKYTTVYGRYPKVYLNIDVEGANLGAATDEDGFHGEVDYVVVLVNKGEAKEYCAVKEI